MRLSSLHLPYNAYLLSLKAYTEDGGPDWKDLADIHNQVCQFDVVADRLIHGLMRFDAEWRGDTINGPKQEPIAPRQESFIQQWETLRIPVAMRRPERMKIAARG
jgi:hypothetical protein